MKEVIKKLDQLAGVRIARESSSKEIELVVEQALRNCPDLKTQYDELQKGLKFLTEKEVELTNQVKEVVIRTETSIKGMYLHAIFTKGKTTWDTKALGGFAIVHPEISQFKKVGQPSVSIREVKEEETN